MPRVNSLVLEDIEGQPRSATSNPGADDFSNAIVRFSPLDSVDVGPFAYSSLAVDPILKTRLKISPNPADQQVHIKNIPTNTKYAKLISTSTGKTVWSTTNLNTLEVNLETKNFPSGTYILQFEGYTWRSIEKLFIQH